MGDIFSEIWNSVRRNKLRTCLTGFAVAWGIFMLIVLLGAGNGLINAILQGSEGVSLNTMTVSGGVTSKTLLTAFKISLIMGLTTSDRSFEVISKVPGRPLARFIPLIL